MQLPRGEERSALGYRMKFEGVRTGERGQDRVVIAVDSPGSRFQALPAMYWSEFNQGYMKKPHIERFITHDIYISPLDMSGEKPSAKGVWFEKGETKQIGQAKYTFVDFDRQMGDELVRIAARIRVEMGGRTVDHDVAGSGLSLDRISLETVSVIHVPDMDFFKRPNPRHFQEISAGRPVPDL